jgi:hypothetical protein
MARLASALGCSRHTRGGSGSRLAERDRMVDRAARAFREIDDSTNPRKLMHVGAPLKKVMRSKSCNVTKRKTGTKRCGRIDKAQPASQRWFTAVGTRAEVKGPFQCESRLST